jgi:dTDP-4-amino-4,6-dideoxygalactose transaminase
MTVAPPGLNALKSREVYSMNPIPIARPQFSQAEFAAVQAVIESGWVTQGPQTAEFERQFAAFAGAPHACAVSNCTAGLHVALLAAGVQPGDVVLTPSLSFIATANSVRACSAEPVFVDVDESTFNISPERLAESLERDFFEKEGNLWFRQPDRLRTLASPVRRIMDPIGRLAAILVVHQLGLPCDLAKLLPLARRYNVSLIEDAACATGSQISLDQGQTWQAIGKPHGRAACFSFHPRKVLTTGDGGMLTTADAGMDRAFRLLRQHGMSISDRARHQSNRVLVEDYEVTGFNYRLTDLQAALGIAQLAKLPTFVADRRALAAQYARRLQNIEGVTLPVEPDYARTNWQSYQVLLDNSAWQRPVMERMLAAGIATRRGVMCTHLEPPYREAAQSLPVSESVSRRGLILPLFPGMSEPEIEIVCQELGRAVGDLWEARADAA